ncbi:hypothetical protein EC968_007647 [Mortierella alpina]|nr:hypothetical protein EC968_007647 [Mortierella alpina]
MLHSQQHGSNLEITVHSAHNLDDVERFGDNDCYVRFSLQCKRNDDFQKTIVKKGKNPEWQQIVLLRDVRPEHMNLYVEVMDEEKGLDEVVAFCTIPLDQVRNIPSHKCSAKFELWTPKSARKGELSLTLRLIPLGEETGSVLTYEGSEKKGISTLDPEHEKRIKSLKMKENVEDAAKTLGAAAAAAGALGAAFGLFGDKDKNKKEGEEGH